MDLDELSTTHEFASLTKKQKMAVATYISNGYDIVNAMRTAYVCKSDEVAKIMSYRFLRAFNVAMTLSLHFGESPQDTYLSQLARDIMKRKISDTQLKAYTLYAEIKGWKKPAIVRAYELAKELGYGPNAKSARESKRDPGTDHIKSRLMTAIREGKKREAEKEANPFDLSDFES